MKRIIFTLLLFALSLCGFYASANHIYGGELLYTYISGNNYRVTLTFYGDCASPVMDSLYASEPLIHIYNDQDSYEDVFLQPVTATGLEVSPVCPGQINQTTCHGGTLPGVRQFAFSDIITLSGPSANWRFIFTGVMFNSYAGRSANITNVGGMAGSSVVYLEATLNNINGPNNSPQYSTIPTPFYCINVPESYNQGAIDADNDSLVFSLVPALDSVSTPTPGNPDAFTAVPVVYAPTYSATAPITVAPGTFSFSVLNGQMNFTPSLVQDALVVIQVSEYRNGLLVGTSKREMTFIVLSTCQAASPPLANIQTNTVNGGELDSTNVLYVCEGTHQVGYNIKAASPSNDSVTVTINNTLPNAIITVQNNNTDSPTINFVWNTDTIKPGVYNFYTTLKNNHCPISNTQTFAYTIYVVRPNTDTAMQLGATGCVHKATVEYDFNYGLLPRTIKVMEGDDLLEILTDSTGKVLDSLKAGKYVIEVSSPYLNCPTKYNFTVVDSGALPSPFNYYFSKCLHDPLDSINFLPFNDASVVWHDMDGTVLPGSPTPNTAIVGEQKWFVIQTYNICTSYSDTVTVTVHNLPDISILTSNAPICLGDKIYFNASGGVDYKWSSTANKLFTDTGGVYTNVLLPDIYTVTGHDSNECVNTVSLKFDSIESCCLFSYPNTFTPNQDNINDKYHVLIYGNTDAFELEIYNRWGQRVFHTFHPEDGWDGTYAGKPCEMGAYFFYVRSHCLTGHRETHKGEILLYR